MYVDYSEVTHLVGSLAVVPEEIGPVAQRVVTKVGHDTVARAQAIAPVDTGALRSSISVDVGDLEFTAGPSVNYAGYVEYGTSKMSAEPYMGPAFAEQVDVLDRILGQVAADLL